MYCENEEGEKFILEMQKVEQRCFKDRNVFYSTFPIREQGQRGSDWDFNLKSVYTVGILNFVFLDDEYYEECYHHEVKLMDTADKHVFFDKLTFVYLEYNLFKCLKSWQQQKFGNSKQEIQPEESISQAAQYYNEDIRKIELQIAQSRRKKKDEDGGDVTPVEPETTTE